jgi:alpha-methylacyl-CoA racemase
MPGPLSRLQVVEVGGIGPAPHAAMVLADLGADVVRVDRAGAPTFPFAPGAPNPLLRGRTLLSLDLKNVEEQRLLMQLIGVADVLIEGYRPGVAERLGIGPDACLEVNPRLIYTRVTGWGQSGPLAQRAGHDINYISLTGVLHAIGHAGARPAVPLNLIGDFGGGSMLALVGILAALYERERSGQGQVVDAAMLDGASLLAQMMWAYRSVGAWSDERADNLLDGGAPYYDTYECQDGRFVAIGAIEPRFFAELSEILELELPDSFVNTDRVGWPELRRQIENRIKTRSRDEWVEISAGRDACVTPILSFAEAIAHPQVTARETLIEVDGVTQPAPAPRFSRTPTDRPVPARDDDANARDIISRWSAAAVS